MKLVSRLLTANALCFKSLRYGQLREGKQRFWSRKRRQIKRLWDLDTWLGTRRSFPSQKRMRVSQAGSHCGGLSRAPASLAAVPDPQSDETVLENVVLDDGPKTHRRNASKSWHGT